jgi:cyclic pyranopterin phosphate synthase
MNIPKLSHLNARGEATMVDVGPKPATRRCAIAGCELLMKQETLRLFSSGEIKKGDAFTVAKVAAILAAKQTAQLIPLCHPLPLENIEIRFQDRPEGDGIRIEADVQTTAKTGVEMEALTAAAVAALTLYDMGKGYDPGMVITNLGLIKKTGGKSGDFNKSSNHHGE